MQDNATNDVLARDAAEIGAGSTAGIETAQPESIAIERFDALENGAELGMTGDDIVPRPETPPKWSGDQYEVGRTIARAHTVAPHAEKLQHVSVRIRRRSN